MVLLPRTYVRAIHAVWITIQSTGEFGCSSLGILLVIATLAIHREPMNCAHSSVKSPHSPPPLIRKDSPRPYHQLNSGTVVLRPSYALAEGLQAILLSQDLSQWNFPDQDLLAAYFKDRWIPLPWYYNALRSLRNTHPVMWSDREIRCLHYIFPEKPWHNRDLPTDLLSQAGFAMMNRWWWERFDPLVKRLRKTDSKSYYTVVKTMQRSK